jgi:type IV fimbrial biogenesis protein FimT
MRRPEGFTLIEAMIVVVILGILAAIGMPSMREFIAAQRLKAPASDLYASLALARSEAIKRNAAIDVVPNATDWAQGWRVRTQGTTPTVLRVQNAYPNISVAASQTGSLTYRGNGRLSTSAMTFRITSPDSSNVNMRCVAVDVSGRPAVRLDTNMDQTACD